MDTQELILRATKETENATLRQKYHTEMAQGKRRPTGQPYLKRLSGKHLTIINYHLAGMTGIEIADRMGCSTVMVSSILTDPLAKAKIDERFAALDEELRALRSRAVNVIRTSMDHADPSVQLSAADKWFRAQGYYNPRKHEDSTPTAEDLVKLLLKESAPGESVTLSVGIERTKVNDIAE